MVCDLINILGRERVRHINLCKDLEEIADNLPNNVDTVKVEAIVQSLRLGIEDHIAMQQELLFLAVRQRAKLDDNIDALLGQLEYEHTMDRDLACELGDVLTDWVEERRNINPDMLGYLLRCFFEGWRRHTAWEQTILAPLCRQRLSAEDSRQLAPRLLVFAKGKFVEHDPA